MRIEVVDTTVQSRNFITKQGEQRVAYNQQVYIWKRGEPYPTKARIPLSSNVPYPVGNYSLNDTAYEVGQYGDLAINRFEITLTPIPATPDKPLSFAKTA